jgi:hypothetical protein
MSGACSADERCALAGVQDFFPFQDKLVNSEG